ncbi:MAG: hypothetical protein IKX59_10535 [Bacteroidales bacterium]|nr:hypothetical protein [Bacteroidales bacterium]
MKYYNGRQSTRCCTMKYYNNFRQSTCYNCENILTASRMLASIGQSISMADRMLPRLDRVLRRPTGYLLR